ncbi:MAG: transglycosylase SLT domain-containing protein [Thermodesulfobacteriota bacterium]
MRELFRPQRIFIWQILFIITMVFLNSPGSQADIYIYVDKEGVVHFTNTPTHGKFKLILKEEIIPPEKKEEPMKEDLPRFASVLTQEKFDSLIWRAAEKYGVNYALIKAIIKAESNFNPLAISKMGAKGLMQLMPGTAYTFQVKDSFHPEKNIEGGVRYLRYLIDLFPHNLYAVLAAYNAGENAVLRYRGVPPYQETRRFIQKVLQYFQQYNQEPKPNFSAFLAK